MAKQGKPATKRAAASKPDSVGSTLRIGHSRDHRTIKTQVHNFRSASRRASDKLAPDVLENIEETKLIAIEILMQLLPAYCNGSVRGFDLSNPVQIQNLTDEEIVHIASAMVEISEEEAKKSEESSASLPQVKLA